MHGVRWRATRIAAGAAAALSLSVLVAACGDGADTKDPTPASTSIAQATTKASPTTPPPPAIVPPEQFVETMCGTWNTYYTRYLELQNGCVGSDDLVEHKRRLTEMTAGLQTAAGVPLQCDEGADFQTFRIGLFGLDKWHDVEGTLSHLQNALKTVGTKI